MKRGKWFLPNWLTDYLHRDFMLQKRVKNKCFKKKTNILVQCFLILNQPRESTTFA